MRKLLLLIVLMALNVSPLWAAGEGWLRYSQGILAVTFLIVALLVGCLSLVWNYHNRYRGKDNFWRFAWKKPLVKMAFACAGIVVVVNVFVAGGIKHQRYADLEFARYRHLSDLGVPIYRDLLDDYPFIVKYHHGYVSAYYEADEWGREGEEVAMNDDEVFSPIPYYQEVLYRKSLRHRDYGLLGMGMSEYYEMMPNLALQQLFQVRDTNLPFRNLYIGRIYAEFDEPELAAAYFRKEFKIGVAKEYAARDYARLVYRWQRDDLDHIRSLVEDPEIGPHVPSYVARHLYTREGNLGAYMGQILHDWSKNVHLVGFLGALLGVLVWASFLRKIDAFKRDSWAATIGAVLLGGMFSFLALPFYDFLEFELGFQSSEDPWKDFLYCWFGIGVVEELVKFIPFLLIWRTTKLIRTPLDYVVYASLVGLGFAFVENLQYFEAGQEHIMHGRLLISVMMHIFLCATMAFAIVLAKYRFRKWLLPMLLLGFLAATFLHGLYDFWLLNRSASPLVFLTYAVFLYATFQYAAYINNCLNHSPVFNFKDLPDPNALAVFLLRGLVAVLMFEFVALALIYGPRIATAEFIQNLAIGGFLMFFLVLNLTNIDVVRGEWIWVRPWDFASRHNYNGVVGKRLRLMPMRKESVLNGMLPATGEVIARLSVGRDNRYFLFQFDHTAHLLGHPLRYVLLKAKEKDAVIESEFKMEVGLIAFRDQVALARPVQRRQDFKFIDYAVVL